MASASLAEPTEHYCVVDDGDCGVVEVRCASPARARQQHLTPSWARRAPSSSSRS